MLAKNLQTIQTANNSLTLSATSSVEPICFKMTLILLTMRNAWQTGMCPSFPVCRLRVVGLCCHLLANASTERNLLDSLSWKVVGVNGQCTSLSQSHRTSVKTECLGSPEIPPSPNPFFLPSSLAVTSKSNEGYSIGTSDTEDHRRL